MLHRRRHAQRAGQVDETGVDGAAFQLPQARTGGHGHIAAGGHNDAIAQYQRAVFHHLARSQHQPRAGQRMPTRRVFALAIGALGGGLGLQGAASAQQAKNRYASAYRSVD